MSEVETIGSSPDLACPKCRSTEWFSRKALWGSYEYVLTGGMHWVYPRNYVCADCGYLEPYVDDAKARERIRKKWLRASDVAPAR